MMPHNKLSVESALQQEFTQFAALIKQLPDDLFTQTPNGSWSAGQHLEHLILSTKPVNLALRLPGWLLILLFGKRNNRPGRNYNEVVEKYRAVLANGAVATGGYVPKPVMAAQRAKLLKIFLSQLKQLTGSLQRITDEQLDNCIVPHPLLGKMTLREVLFFTIYHTGHHLKILQSREKLEGI
ncbi:DinB family protein [Sphingobacteriales bacterium UPWRP_1]|nr:hypothetical protein B6N25_05895 [Sphingobacteriales bacterium TSM_CSS]PSJ74637.1 DinB family protein [Sphingobacteriales bacterium UPWRP_1]